MSHFLFIVDMPPERPGSANNPPMNTAASWPSFEIRANEIALPNQDSTRLCRNVWLLDAEKTLPILLNLSSLAKKHELSYSAHLIDGDITQLVDEQNICDVL
ncbi:hypothetical protein [Janthinobacterium sp. B9-8]|uniref:hypothetical protein n=1 Tax=Janthinobacterium sp. B9-8 TaxID=1236179 RepID=UPI00061D1401|nr:hypothetical protein [Janthinobacterium sp. B9-8]AMC34723.1 hypothetical protein VN23_08935 [Janthinobacterium sp. B9-8]